MSEHLRASVADIDARLDALQIEMQRLADAKGVLWKLMGVSIVESPPPAPAPSPAAAAVKPPSRPAAIPAASPRPREKPRDLDESVLLVLARANGPVAMARVVEGTGHTRDNVRFALARLRKAGRVLATGATATRRFEMLQPKGNGRAAAQPAADLEEDAPRTSRVQPGESLLDTRRRLDRGGR